MHEGITRNTSKQQFSASDDLKIIWTQRILQAEEYFKQAIYGPVLFPSNPMQIRRKM